MILDCLSIYVIDLGQAMSMLCERGKILRIAVSRKITEYAVTD